MSDTQVPARMMPTVKGFYWAKWRIADEGTDDGGECCAGADAHWEVVEVFENTPDVSDAEHFMVGVAGVTKCQSLENFFWGPGPLVPPPDKTQ